jgi:hypothetical protein
METTGAGDKTTEAGDTGKPKVSNSSRAKAVGMLLLAAVLGSLAGLPYVHSIERRPGRAEKRASELMSEFAEYVLIESLISMGLIVVGLRLRTSLGLGLSLLNDWPPDDDDARRRLRNTITLAVVLGIGMAVILAIADHFVEPMFPKPRRPLPTPPAWTGLLASVGAGIQEEIWLRLGFMTFLVWLGTQIVRLTPPAPGVVWTANALAATLFGALHLPQVAVLIGLNVPIVAFTLLGNGAPGVVFGWLYWRRGLVAAMVSHVAADCVLKAVLPLLGLA